MTVTLLYDPKWAALEWAYQHCPSFRTTGFAVSGKVAYYFNEETDAVLFSLRWS